MKPDVRLTRTYAVERRIEPFFTGDRIHVDWTHQLIVSPCNGAVCLSDAGTGQRLATIEPPGDANESVNTVAFDASGGQLAVAYDSGLLRHWTISGLPSPPEPVLQRTWKSMHVGPVARLQFDTTGSLLASAGSDGILKIWNVPEKLCSHQLREAAPGVIDAVVFAPRFTANSYRVLATGADCRVHVWDLVEGRHVAGLDGHHDRIGALLYMPDGARFVSGSRDQLAIVWDATSLTKERSIPLFESIEAMAVVPGAALRSAAPELLVSGGQSGLLKAWDLRTGVMVHSQTESVLANVAADPRLTTITQLVYQWPNHQLVAVSFDKDLVWHQLDGTFRPLRQLPGHIEQVYDLKLVGAQETHVAIAMNSPRIKVVKLDGADSYLLAGHTDVVLALCRFGHDPLLMASAAKDNTVRVWRFRPDGTGGHCMWEATGHTHSVLCVAGAHAAGFLLSGSQDTTLKLWRVPSSDNQQQQCEPLKCQYTQSCHERSINAIDVAPNDQLAATGSQDRTAKLWALPRLQLVGVLRGHRKAVWAVRFSPVDQALATSSADATVRLWSTSSQACLRTFHGHESSVLRVEFIDQAMQLLTSSSDGSLKLWRLRDADCAATMDGHAGKVWALELSADQQTLVTGGDDSLLQVWRNATDQLLEQETARTAETVQQEQALCNEMRAGQWDQALRIAIRLEQPLRCLAILREMLLEGQTTEALVSQLDRLRPDQLLRLCQYAQHWNSNSKHWVVAQCVLRSCLHCFAPDRLLAQPEWKERCRRMLPYCHRHQTRINRLRQYVGFGQLLHRQMKS